MRAIWLFLLILPTCVSLVAGCSSARWTWQSPIVSAPKPKPANPDDKATKTADVAAKETSEDPKKPATTTAAAESPFKPSRAAESSSAPPVAPEKIAKVEGTPGDPASPGKPDATKSAAVNDNAIAQTASGSLTPEVLQLINQELQDATAAERQEWYEQLKKVDPTLIPDILRVRRMSLQATSQTQIAAAELDPRPARTSPGMDASRMLSTGNPPSSPWSSPAAAEPIQPVGYQNQESGQTLLTADYVRDAGQSEQIEHAVHRVDPTAPMANRPIVLQNHEYAPPASDLSGNPQRLSTQTAQPAGVPWPVPRVEATAPPSTGFGNVPFASGLVQNVVNLVPGRGAQVAAANLPTTPSGLPAGTQNPSADWHVALEQTIGLLEQDLAAMPPATTPEAKHELLKKHTSLRMLYLIGNHQERALTAIPGIEPAEQEFWQQLLWGMINALDAEHMPLAKDRATQTMTQLNSAIRRLQEQADLQVRHVTFCRQILGFGNYEKLPKGEFSPGQEVLMYADIDNFKSDPTADGQYRTLLRSTIELMSPSGEVRKRIEFPATEDQCSTYRRDYFHNYQFRVPERMPLGPHVLKLTVFDELSGKMNSYSLNFVVK